MKDHILENSINIIRNLMEDAPVMSMGAGGIAGSVEAGDDPPVRKKKKRRMSGGAMNITQYPLKRKLSMP